MNKSNSIVSGTFFAPGNQEEAHYLDLLRKIKNDGHARQTRNGVVHSLFSAHLSFDLGQSFPLLTTKKMFLRGIFEELKFFMLGKTDSKLLENKGVNIWKGNTSREFLDSVGLHHYPEGQMGPMYGHQWRRFGAPIVTDEKEETGVDQLQNVIDLLIADRFSRRILMTTYNPAQTDQGVLPPCHGIAIQFGIEGTDRLCCHMYQRSCDTFLGCPFNIASYALLVHIICILVNCRLSPGETTLCPGTLTMSFGDYHIYEQHLDAVNIQLERAPKSFPQLRINVNGTDRDGKGQKKLTCLDDIEYLEMSDLELIGYECCPAIKAPMVA